MSRGAPKTRAIGTSDAVLRVVERFKEEGIAPGELVPIVQRLSGGIAGDSVRSVMRRLIEKGEIRLDGPFLLYPKAKVAS
jgi:hypothetical protein